MIRYSCIVENCFFVIHYFSPITMQDLEKSPPFKDMPLLDGEHEHQWKVTEVKIGGKK